MSARVSIACLLVIGALARARPVAEIERDIRATERQLAEAEAQLGDAERNLSRLLVEVEHLEKLIEGYEACRTRLSGPKESLANAFAEYMRYFSLRVASDASDRDETIAREREAVSPELRALSRWRRSVRFLEAWVLPDFDRYGAYGEAYVRAENELERVRRAYWQARDAVDKTIRDDPELGVPGTPHPATFEELERLVRPLIPRCQELKRRIATLDGPVEAQGSIRSLRKKRDDLATLLGALRRELRLAGEEAGETARPEGPPPRPETQGGERAVVASAIKISRPSPRDLQSGSYGSVSPYEVYFAVEVPGLPPGTHRIQIRLEPGGDRYLWCTVKAGDRRAPQFKGYVPVRVGPFSATLLMPDLSGVEPVRISGVMRPPSSSRPDDVRRAQESVARSREKLAQATPQNREYYEKELGGSISRVAYESNQLGQHDQALAACGEAMRFAREEVTSGTGFGMGATVGSVLKIAAWAHYWKADAGAMTAAMKQLIAYDQRMAGRAQGEGLRQGIATHWAAAAETCVLLAQRLLALRGDAAVVEEARKLLEEALDCRRKAGVENPSLPDWFSL